MDIKTETSITMTFFKNRFVTMIETPTFLSSDIIAEKSGYKKIIFQKLLFMTLRNDLQYL